MFGTASVLLTAENVLELGADFEIRELRRAEAAALR
jgi:hypothetical protein